MNNISMIDLWNANAFLPRSVAPTTFWYPGSALPTGGAALVLTGGLSKRRTATDPRTAPNWIPLL